MQDPFYRSKRLPLYTKSSWGKPPRALSFKVRETYVKEKMRGLTRGSITADFARTKEARRSREERVRPTSHTE